MQAAVGEGRDIGGHVPPMLLTFIVSLANTPLCPLTQPPPKCHVGAPSRPHIPRRQQKQAKRFEDMASGRYRPLVADPSKLDGELAAAGARLDAVLRALDAVRQTVPQLAAEVEKIMYHVDL